MYLARRLVRMASEEIGLADPRALSIAVAAKDAYHLLGSPEGELALAQSAIYLAAAPKSNAAYRAYKAAMGVAKTSGSLAPPPHILNAPTALMRDEGYGKGYAYDHDAEDAFSGQDYFPEALGRQQFYHPTPRGEEEALARHLNTLSSRRRVRQSGDER